MARFDPPLDVDLERRGLPDEILGLGTRSDPGAVVAHRVPLPAASVEVGDSLPLGRAHRKLDSEESRSVRSHSLCPVPGAGDRHLRKEESSLIRETEPVVVRETEDPGILEIPIHRRPEIIDLGLSWRPPGDAVVCQELLPGHLRFQ